MSRPPKNKPMTELEIKDLVAHKRSSSKLYKAEAKEVTDKAISATVQKAVSLMKVAETTGKINLDDTETVRRIVGAYLEMCVNESVCPSMQDVAVILGYSRRNLYYYMRSYKDTETGKFLHQMHEIIANTLADNALKGNVNAIVGIFVLKSLYGFRETDETVEKLMETDNDDIFRPSLAELRKKYMEFVDEDE